MLVGVSSCLRLRPAPALVQRCLLCSTKENTPSGGDAKEELSMPERPDVKFKPYDLNVDADKFRIRVTKHTNWIDSLRIYCRGGHGGNGFKPRGGIGGQGGDVILQTPSKAASEKKKKAVGGKKLRAILNNDTNLNGVYHKHFKGKKQRLIGGDGENANHDLLLGAQGKDTTLTVPVGVTLSDDSGRILYDLDEPNLRVIAAHGGQGGGPANNWCGLAGQSRQVRLELKLLADIGLVGFPNAGKSTLLKAISRARPKIASYPFTTLRPNLGHLEYPDERVVTMADLPGLIEGASFNVGMGHKFLRHVERTSLLLFVIDVQGFQINPNSVKRSAVETVALLNRELELYQPELLDKPAVCLVNKMDTDASEAAFEELRGRVSGSDAEWEAALGGLGEEAVPRRRIVFDDILPMSAKFSRKSVLRVKRRVRRCLDERAGIVNETSLEVLEAKLDEKMEEKGPKIA